MIQEKLDNYRKEIMESHNTLKYYLSNEILNIVKNNIKIGVCYQTSNDKEKSLFKVVNFKNDILIVEIIKIKNIFHHESRLEFMLTYIDNFIFKADDILGDIIEIDEYLFNDYKSKCLSFSR